MQREFISSCLFLEAHNIYVIAITDSGSKVSRFEIYSFRQTGLIQDRYRLKNASGSSRATMEMNSRQSVAEVLNNPNNMARKNTLFSSIPASKDVKN